MAQTVAWFGRIAALLLVVGALTGCLMPLGPTAAGPLRVVAAENVWGSLAAQLGGGLVQVVSIIDNPNADPHDYEPTTADARDMATASFVIVNGIGYDPWADRLLASNPAPGRHVLDVGSVLGVPDGGNPHRWYSPPDVDRFVDAVAAEYAKLDPRHAATFERQRASFETNGLATYHALISDIRTTYAGTPVGASESIFALLAPALGLRLLTPATFLSAISEGAEPTAADKAAIDEEFASHQIDVFVANSQNVTPDVQRQIDEARAAGIPVTSITETLVPAGATFQAWQVRQLQALQTALAQGTGL